MPQDDTSRQLGLTIVAVIDTGGSDGCPPEPFDFGPIASPLRSERLDAVPLQVRQRTKVLLELGKTVGHLRQQVQTGAPDLGLAQIPWLEEKSEQGGRAA